MDYYYRRLRDLLYKTSTDYLLGLTNNPKPPEDLPE